MKFQLIRERQRPVYVPSPAELRGLQSKKQLDAIITIGICLVIAAVAVYSCVTDLGPGAVQR